ncbi:uncharacterized protein LOC134239795 [Saccostrea cucullata]|uniref:uncharacterized protein LOC134239795 n=1 Tax=Saccostrea cuccullata TaxID=36930 RepID=UPI002ED4D04B
MVSNSHVLKYLCFMIFSGTGFGQEICDSNTGPVCCDGYYKDQITGNCTSCKPGYFDFNCSKMCGYPTYGDKCQEICRCNKMFCNFAFGCRLNTDMADTSGSHTSTEPLSPKVRSSLVFLTRITSIGINLDRSYQIQDIDTYTKSEIIIDNEKINWKTNSNISTANSSGFPSSVIIVSIICSTLLFSGLVFVVIILLRKFINIRNRNVTFRNDPVNVSDTMMSDYDVLNNRNVFRGLAEISIDYSEITQSYSVNFKTKPLDTRQPGINIPDSGHVYLDLDDSTK